MIKKIRAGVLLLFFLLLSFEACKAGDAEKEAGTKGWKEAADAAENEEQVKKSSSDTTCYTFEDVEGNSYQAELLDEVAKNPYNFKNLVTNQKADIRLIQIRRSIFLQSWGWMFLNFRARIQTGSR